MIGGTVIKMQTGFKKLENSALLESPMNRVGSISGRGPLTVPS